MPTLDELSKKFTAAYSVAGSVIVFHESKHRNVGTYAGEGVVILNLEGEKLMASVAEPVVEPAAKPEPDKKKAAKKKDEPKADAAAPAEAPAADPLADALDQALENGLD